MSTSSSSAIKRVIATLNIPTKMGDKEIRIQSIVSKLAASVYFPVASWPANIVSYAQFQTDVNAFISAETALKNHTGTSGARNTALTKVMADLHGILSMVQNKADANLSNAQDIILSAGFGLRNDKPKAHQQNDALNTQVQGMVLLTSDTTGHHEWQMSKDMVNIINLPATPVSKTTVSGLTPGDVWYFRNHKVNTKQQTYNWSPWVKLLISGGGRTAGGNPATGHAGSLPASA